MTSKVPDTISLFPDDDSLSFSSNVSGIFRDSPPTSPSSSGWEVASAQDDSSVSPESTFCSRPISRDSSLHKEERSRPPSRDSSRDKEECSERCSRSQSSLFHLSETKSSDISKSASNNHHPSRSSCPQLTKSDSSHPLCSSASFFRPTFTTFSAGPRLNSPAEENGPAPPARATSTSTSTLTRDQGASTRNKEPFPNVQDGSEIAGPAQLDPSVFELCQRFLDLAELVRDLAPGVYCKALNSNDSFEIRSLDKPNHIIDPLTGHTIFQKDQADTVRSRKQGVELIHRQQQEQDSAPAAKRERSKIQREVVRLLAEVKSLEKQIAKLEDLIEDGRTESKELAEHLHGLLRTKGQHRRRIRELQSLQTVPVTSEVYNTVSRLAVPCTRTDRSTSTVEKTVSVKDAWKDGI